MVAHHRFPGWSPPQLEHSSGNSSPTREVSWERGFSPESQQPPAACPPPACPAFAASLCFPVFPFRQRSNGRPQRVIRSKHALLPVLPQRRHEIDYTIEELALLRHGHPWHRPARQPMGTPRVLALLPNSYVGLRIRPRHKILQSVYQTVANRDHDFHCLQRR